MSVVDIYNPDSIRAALAELELQDTQDGVTATADDEEIADLKQQDKEARIAALIKKDGPLTDKEARSLVEASGPLTEKEAIKLIEERVAEDIEYEERSTFDELVELLRDVAEARGSAVSNSRIEQIVQEYAPNAPRTNYAPAKVEQPAELDYVPEVMSLIQPLVSSGVAYRGDYSHWWVKRCRKCGQFKTVCCGQIDNVSLVRDDEKTLTSLGRQAVGLDPIKPPKPPKTQEELQLEITQGLGKTEWWNSFRGVDELQGTGSVKFYIENFIPEGVTLISGLPKEGKSFIATSIAKALTSGRPLFNRPGFEVPEAVPVLYLAAEGGDGGLKLRCEKMSITRDKTQFICRTLSQGLMLELDDPQIESLVKAIRPVVILETLVRFNHGKDEDDAMENRKLAESLFRLIAWGARAVIAIHHSRKNIKANPSKEAAIRGSGDLLAMADCAWLVMQDTKLLQEGKGPNEIDLVGWARDFNPTPMRLALTGLAPEDWVGPSFAPGIVSYVDTEHDLKWVDRGLVFKAQEMAGLDQIVESLVEANSAITLVALCNATGQKQWKVRKVLKQLGYHRGQGDNSTTQWVKNRSD